MTVSALIQRHRVAGTKLTSIVLAAALVAQFVLGSFAQAALVPSNQVGTDLIGFDLDGTTYSVNGSGQESGAGEFAQGQINDYPEGACIPALITVTNNDDEAGDIAISPMFDYSNTQNSIIGIESLEVITTSLGGSAIEDDADDLSDFAYSLDGLETAASFPSFTVTGNGNNQVTTDGTVSATVSGPYSGNDTGTAAPTATDEFRHYNVTLLSVDPDESVVVVLCARVGEDASEWQGATPSLRLAGEGQENVGIQTSQLLVLPTLTIVKQVVGSDAAADLWSFVVTPTINGETSFEIPDGGDTVVIDDVPVDGTYTITEVGPSGYTVTAGEGSLNCTFDGEQASVTLAAGKPATNATCVFVNTYDAPPEPTTGTLTVYKDVTNDDGGTLGSADFSINVTDGDAYDNSFAGVSTAANGTVLVLEAGSYTVSETAVSGYAGDFSACGSEGVISVTAGQNVDCTIVNDDIAPTLKVTKIVSGGEKDASEFTLLVDETTVSSGVATAFDAGTYTVSEVNDPAYTSAISGDCDVEGGITLALGDVKECTITNTIIVPPEETGTITVVKDVQGGDAQVSDFPLFIGEMSVTSGETKTLPIGNYTVSETNEQTNYVGAFSGDCDENGNIQLVEQGQNLTCTITNTYVPPAPTTATLTVIKSVVGSQAAPSSFTLNVTGSNASPSSFAGDADGTEVTVDIGGEYSVTEDEASGYATTYSEGCSGTMTAQGATCTVTNTFIVIEEPTQGTLTVVKVVINDDGGSAQVTDFPLFINETLVTSGTANSRPAGQYVVAETGSADYLASFSGDCDANGVVSLEDGDQKTCTITNDDKEQGGGSNPAGTLIVVTKVINDDGGIAIPSMFLMTVGDGIATSSTFGGFDTPGFSLSYFPGAYAVNGSANAAYDKTMGPNCSGTMVAGLTVTCVVTYDDRPTGGSPTPPEEPPAPLPEPEVLGATDSATAPVPKVLGATDSDLPVTGIPAWALAAFLLAAAPLARRKQA